MSLPTSKNEFLEEMLAGLRKRRKAIKHQNTEIKCERCFETIDGERFEKLEIDFEYRSIEKRVHLRVLIWSDRMIWIDIRSWRKPHWEWSWTDEGRFLANFPGREFIDAVEKTLSLSVAMVPSNTVEFQNLWSPMLAKGPIKR